ncbi:hypothetical protein ABFV55_27920, partial [Pseudomonas syringae]|uniref:hypothetical protein n=1 Tax=Pseudomonas syringae TaxID=317 RepID=UPI0034D95E7D
MAEKIERDLQRTHLDMNFFSGNSYYGFKIKVCERYLFSTNFHQLLSICFSGLYIFDIHIVFQLHQ